MKKRLMLLLFAGILGVTQAGAESIWKAKGDHELYLFGTIHMLRAADYPLPSVYDRTFERCERLWLETDMDALEDPQMTLKLQAGMSLPPGELLDAHISAETFQALKAEAARQGIPMAMLMPMKPWGASLVLSMTAMMQQGFDPAYGLDTHLQGKAQANAIPVAYLETVEEQFELLDRAGSVSPEKFVKQTLDEISRIDELTGEMVQAWEAGNQEQLLDLMGLEEYPKVSAILLDERNNQWVNTLMEQGSPGTVDCVAVGGLHVAGDTGLIRQFEAAGYTVSQVLSVETGN